MNFPLQEGMGQELEPQPLHMVMYVLSQVYHCPGPQTECSVLTQAVQVILMHTEFGQPLPIHSTLKSLQSQDDFGRISEFNCLQPFYTFKLIHKTSKLTLKCVGSKDSSHTRPDASPCTQLLLKP